MYWAASVISTCAFEFDQRRSCREVKNVSQRLVIHLMLAIIVVSKMAQSLSSEGSMARAQSSSCFSIRVGIYMETKLRTGQAW